MHNEFGNPKDSWALQKVLQRIFGVRAAKQAGKNGRLLHPMARHPAIEPSLEDFGSGGNTDKLKGTKGQFKVN